MSSNSQSGSWFIRSKDGIRGPLTAEQISGLLRQGLVQTSDLISRKPDSGEWRTIQEILLSPGAAPRAFNPPPRPAALQNQDHSAKHPLISNDDFEQTNPTLTLFNTLQAAKDRRPVRGQEQLAPPPITVKGASQSGLSNSKLIAASLAAIAIAIAVWAIPKLFKSNPSAIAEKSKVEKSVTPESVTKPSVSRTPPRTEPRIEPRTPTVPANAAIRRERFNPRAAAPAPTPDSRSADYDGFPSGSENRGTIDDPVENEPFAEPLNAGHDDSALRENGEDLNMPPHVVSPSDGAAGGEGEATLPDGSAFPPPAFD